MCKIPPAPRCVAYVRSHRSSDILLSRSAGHDVSADLRVDGDDVGAYGFCHDNGADHAGAQVACLARRDDVVFHGWSVGRSIGRSGDAKGSDGREREGFLTMKIVAATSLWN